MIDITELRANDWLLYPNRGLDPLNNAYYIKGKVHEVNMTSRCVTIVNDENSPVNQTGANIYHCDLIDPINVTDNILCQFFHFERKFIRQIHGLPIHPYYERQVGDYILRVFKVNESYCLIWSLGDSFGFYNEPIVYFHRLQNLIADLSGGVVEDIMIQ